MPCPAGAKDFFLPVGEGATQAIVHARLYENVEAAVTLIHFHGNGEIVADYDEFALELNNFGVETIACDYRGYGKSTGEPKLRFLLSDALAIINELDTVGLRKKRSVVMGRSLGSAAALELAVKIPGITACILESAYADPIRLLRRRGIEVSALSEDENSLYNHSHKIQALQCPLLILHGAQDVLIYADEAELNYANAGTLDKKLVLFPGVGHNDIFYAADEAYFLELKTFLARFR